MTKTDTSTSSNSNPNPSLHPTYSVNNIQSKVRTLDGTTVTYSAWIKLFKFHATAYRVLNHLDDTPPPADTDPTYPAWKELGALVSQWIYSCVSNEYMEQILDTEASARQTWLKLEKLFLSNKRAKAAALETQFVNLTLSACSSVDDYYKQLKNLVNQLADVDQQITEERLVLQLVRGLSKEFDTTASLINSQAADWDTAKSMLNDEVIRQAARQQQSSTMLATTVASPPQQPADNNQYQQPRDPITQYTQSSNQYRGRGRGRGNQWAWWNTPPCPYPTQPNWQPNTPPPPGPPPSANYTGYPAPATYGPPGYNALCPSDLSAAMNNVNITYTDPTPHMDTGAERHVTDNQGMIHHPDLFHVNTKLLVSNGQYLPIEGSGTGYLPIHNRTYILPNILYSPHIIKNLLFVRRFTRDNNVSIEFDPLGFSLKDLKMGRLLSRHNSTGDLYPVTAPTLPPQACSLTAATLPWHDRLSHPGKQVFDILSRNFGLSFAATTTAVAATDTAILDTATIMTAAVDTATTTATSATAYTPTTGGGGCSGGDGVDDDGCGGGGVEGRSVGGGNRGGGGARVIEFVS
ncbi:uncharacterized protein LOC143596833 [Bidens hawaiensis]|uniref:uncharacterized protein LOC143596833 n=1 Tax=Bidens hawaiensis TaxID=980011 RepID=UPI0040498C13